MLRMVLVFALVAGVAGVAVFSMAQPAAASHPEDVTVEVGDFWFCDQSFQGGTCVTNILEGATVTWDFSPMGILELHTTTECGPACPPELAYTPLWDSGLVGPGPGGAGDPTSYTFNTPGTYDYFCEVHPFTMSGQVVVGSVGGIAEIDTSAGAAAAAAEASPGSNSLTILLTAGLVAATAATLGGTAWYARRRLT